jgi:hypothetical protein
MDMPVVHQPKLWTTAARADSTVASTTTKTLQTKGRQQLLLIPPPFDFFFRTPQNADVPPCSREND